MTKAMQNLILSGIRKNLMEEKETERLVDKYGDPYLLGTIEENVTLLSKYTGLHQMSIKVYEIIIHQCLIGIARLRQRMSDEAK